MGIALDAFGWSADQFWKATPHEFFAMVEARQGNQQTTMIDGGR